MNGYIRRWGASYQMLFHYLKDQKSWALAGRDRTGIARPWIVPVRSPVYATQIRVEGAGFEARPVSLGNKTAADS